MNCKFIRLASGRLKCTVCARVVKSDGEPDKVAAKCRGAAVKVAPDKTPDDLPCLHRGELLRVIQCPACGFRDKPLEVYQCDRHEECTMHNRGAHVGDSATGAKCKACLTCQDRTSLVQIPALPPIENVIKDRSRLGKPWLDHRVTVHVAHLDTPEILDLSVRYWLAQDELPFVLITDTGSRKPESLELLDRLANLPGVEVARLGIGGTEHTSDRCAIAIDYALSRCPTEHLLLTHVDVFPAHDQLTAKLLRLCDDESPVVGWEMSERVSRDGRDLSAGVPGHCCLMLHVPTMDRLGAGWSIRRGANAFGLPRGKTDVSGWPDTEVCFGRILDAAGIRPLFLGRETNGENQTTEDWTHLRSLTVSALTGGLLPRHVAGLAAVRARIAPS